MGRIARILSFVRNKINDSHITDVKVDPDAGDNKTVQHFAPVGDDSHPLLTDYVYFTDVPGTGRGVTTGYVDPQNEQVAGPGEKRTYARDDTGKPVTQIYQKNDGSVLISNDNGSVLLKSDGGSIITTPSSTVDCAADGKVEAKNDSGTFVLQPNGAIKGNNIGYFELQQSGIFEVNGVTIDLAGNIVTPTTVTSVTSTSASVIATTSLTVAGKEMDNHIHSDGTYTTPTGGDVTGNSGVPV